MILYYAFFVILGYMFTVSFLGGVGLLAMFIIMILAGAFVLGIKELYHEGE